MTFKILVSDGLSEAGLKLLATAGEVTANPKITPEELIAALPEFDALVVRSRTKVNTKVIAAGTKLKVIGRAGVGVDNIDVQAATRRGIVVMNTPGGSSATVAELTMALMLGLARHVPQATASIKAGRWEKKRFEGHELCGKTLGLVGLGKIGAMVAERALGLPKSY